ncbi:hypothetical protein JTE90_021306 [Oedothorax gibbosus]|uniref:Uncharacterized protein n=1 Tax=Oedothorax gibbosus TaxID=931172 RepID=A0AAV6VPY0_9ARAC|nr:hypothetical protein JTE90_021306 [Oedothorax gibbosus]
MIGSVVPDVTSWRPQSDVVPGDGDNREKLYGVMGKKWEGTSSKMVDASHDQATVEMKEEIVLAWILLGKLLTSVSVS